MKNRNMHHSHHGFMGGEHEPRSAPKHTHSSKTVPVLGSDDITAGGNPESMPASGDQGEGMSDAGDNDGDEEPAGTVPVEDFTDRPAARRNKP